MILCSNPKKQYKSFENEINTAIKKVLESGYYVNGEEVKNFESEFSEYIGCKEGIGVGSGTDALQISLESLGIGIGDEVITVSHGGIWAASVVCTVGATPVFVDIKKSDFTMDVSLIQSKITEKTKAIIAVHLYGKPVEMNKLMEISRKNNLFVIEDCAQSHGAEYQGQKVGSIGNIGCFSFYPTKNLGAIGDGGIIVTNDSNIAKKARLLKEYGWNRKFDSQIVGRNSRLDELQAAILRVKLRYLDQETKKRKQLAKRYSDNLKDTKLVLPIYSDDEDHVFHLYVIRFKGRDFLIEKLKNEQIHTMVHYPYPVHLQEAFKDLNLSPLDVTEKLSKEILSLPIYPELSFEDVDNISSIIKNIINNE